MVSCVNGEKTRPVRVETAWPDLQGPRLAFGGTKHPGPPLSHTKQTALAPDPTAAESRSADQPRFFQRDEPATHAEARRSSLCYGDSQSEGAFNIEC